MQPPEFKTGVLRPVEVYKEAWAIMKDEFWLIFAITLVAILVGSLVPVVLMGPMMCGLYMCLLDKIDGRKVIFDRLFKGFNYFVPGLVVALLFMVPVIVFIVMVYAPMIGIAIAGSSMSEEALLPFIVGMIALELLFAVIMTVIHSLLIFSFPLIADRGLNGFEAVKLSAKAVWANRGGVAGLFGVGILVAIAGYAALCVGIYLAVPVLMMAMAVAYRKVFPFLESPRFDPPPPDAYQGL
jgi:uncharacterized membrane protein